MQQKSMDMGEAKIYQVKNKILTLIMINFDNIAKENMKQHRPNWSQIPDHQYRILAIGGSLSGKTKS